MDEREIYKHVLHEVIDKSENHQINNTEEMIRTLIRKLEDYQLPRINRE
ncbi:hypothetical protein [Aquibacillus sediminis]|nr:hypothetical protein [Aquibacillus sediminis]